MAKVALQDIIDARITAAGQGATTLDGLSDVVAAAPSTGQALVWNGSAWAPGEVAASSGITSVNGDTGPSVTLTAADLQVAPLKFNNQTHANTTISVAGLSDIVLTLSGNLSNLALTWAAGVDTQVVTFHVKQDVTGGRTLTFGAGEVDTWPYSQTPIIDPASEARTTFTLVTYNGGTTVHGYHSQVIKELKFAFPPGEATVLNAVSNFARIQRPHRFIRAWCDATSAPTDEEVVDVLLNGSTSIWASNASDRPRVAAAQTTGTSTTTFTTAGPATTGIGSAGARYQAKVVTAATADGEGLSVTLEYLEG